MPDRHLSKIRDAYGLPLQNMTYLHRGWGGDCYTAETSTGERYFLKFHDPTESLALAPSPRPFYLPLTYQLHHNGILPHIPHPIPTVEGALSLNLHPYTLVMTNFIQGDLLGFEPFPESTLAEVAHQVGILHSALPHLTFEQPFVDHFQTSFQPILDKFLSLKQGQDPSGTAGSRALDAALLPRRAEIRSALKRLKELQAYAQSSQPGRVVCHTDIHGANLMRGTDGQLYLLDWENAMIAPPEHDLIFFAGEPGFLETFFPIYAHLVGRRTIDLQLLEFHLLRRALEDIADFILRIRSGSGTPERDKDDLRESIEILDSLPQIQTTLDHLARHFP